MSILLAIVFASCAPWTLWQGWDDVHFDTDQPFEVPTRVVRDTSGHEGLTLVRASVNERTEGWFVLDTGASVAVLDDEIARAAGLSQAGSVGIGGCGLRADVQKGTAFQLGQFVARDPVFVVFDLDRFLQDLPAGVKVAGIIGHAVLQHAVVHIDYDPTGDHVRLESPAAFEAAPDHWHAAQIVDGGPAVEGSIAGGAPGLFFLDTGKSGTVSLSVPYIERHRLLDGLPVEPAVNRRPCGFSDELEGTVESMTLAGHRIDAPTVRFRLPGTEGGDADRASDAVVGREILKQFDVTFDYGNRRVRLVPN